MTNVFCVRAEYGQYTSAFVNNGYIAIGWLDQTDLGNLKINILQNKIKSMRRCKTGSH